MAKTWVLDGEEWVRLGDHTRVSTLALREFEKVHHGTLRGIGIDDRLERFLEFSPKEQESGVLKKPVQAKAVDPIAVAEKEAAQATEEDALAASRASNEGMPDPNDAAPTDCCIVCGLRVPRSESDAGEV